MLRRQPIARQIIALVTAAVLATAGLMIAITFNGPPPKAPPIQLGDVTRALRGEIVRHPGSERLHSSVSTAMPQPGPDEQRDPELERQLAAGLPAAPANVRAYVTQLPPPRPPSDRFPEPPRGMPRFLPGEGRFAWQHDGQWHVVRLDTAPISVPWWATVAIATALLLSAIVALAWRSALAITQPLDRLAAHVRGEGKDLHVAEQGASPPEISVVAGALAAFQRAQLDLVAQRTRMLSAIAHDMGTPLARLAFRLEALPEPQREAAQSDIAAVRRLIEDSLALDRSSSEPAERFDLAELATTMVRECRDLGQAVEAGEMATAPIMGSERALRRLLQNLIDNALRYGESARISLSLRRTAALLYVHDRGGGFSDEMLRYGPEPFARGEKSRNSETGGNGLGLAIAVAIAEQHRGTLILHNTEEGGEVLVGLPLADTV